MSEQPPKSPAVADTPVLSRRQQVLLAVFRRSPWIIFIGLIALLVFVLVRWDDLESNRRHQSTNNAYVHFDTISLETKVSGYVRDVAFSDFQHVAAGTVLVTLVDDEYRMALKQAQANLDHARATLANLTIEERLQQERVEEARAVLSSAQAKFNLAQREHHRHSALAKQGAISRSIADTTETNLKAAQAEKHEREVQVAVQQSNLELLKADRALREANVKAAEAAVENARIDLSHTRLSAPVDAITSSAQVRRGELVKVGTQVVSLVPVQTPYVIANYKETQLTRIQPGQPVEVSIDSFPGQMIKGHVASISPASGATFALLPTDNSSGNFTKVVQRIPVRIDLDDGQELVARLRAGMSVTSVIDTEHDDG